MASEIATEPRLALVGAGVMGGALARGLARSGAVPASRMTLYDAMPAVAERLRADLAGEPALAASAADAVAGADVVLLAVKPHVVLPLLPSLGLTERHLLLSIAAGVTTANMEAALPHGVPVVRVMPNTPALVGMGAAAISGGRAAQAAHLDLAQRLLSAVGESVVVEERLMDAVTGLSGSGPAYVFLFLEALIDGGVKAGLPRAAARRLAVQTVRGAAEMLRDAPDHPAALKDSVTTPGGTTIAALAVLERAGLRGTIIDAVEASARRSKELSEAS